MKMKRILSSVSAILAICCILLSFSGCFEELLGASSATEPSFAPLPTNNTTTNAPQSTVVSGDLEINFLELGNKYTGDCTYIKAGENDILIDAGSKTSSVETINAFLKQHVTDGTLEYVIVTHAHEDHYAGFATTENNNSIFDLYECEVIIDFSQITSGKEEQKMYNNYIRESNE